MTIYLDHQASTPVDPEVFAAMRPFFSEKFGNPASRHHEYGWVAEAHVEKARERVAKFFDARPSEVTFTSGATESNALALLGIAGVEPTPRRKEFLASAVEHASVLRNLEALGRRGFEVARVPVDDHGRIRLDELEKRVGAGTLAVSVMAANNEVGTFNPLPEVYRICREKGALLHVDAAQGAGRTAVGLACADMISVSSHKAYGPKGVGALIVRGSQPRVRLAPLYHGGDQEKGRRPGTLNVPGIVGLGKALEILSEKAVTENERLQALSRRFLDALQAAAGGVRVNGHPTERLPGCLSLTVADVDGEALLLAARRIAFSSGSACASATREPSHVLRAMGLPDEEILGTVRIGFGRFSTEAEADEAADELTRAIVELRRLSPLHAAQSEVHP